ncbi:hypothetical protein SCHPADRAFT_889384 [Schizopora paradoxa]|uniref:Uncharacterized protein n=1 Tax=Schizopora paradoxa TaxID=27342 RepID=A0A0H2RXN4_9AGAM|nr:hypothetical protein SCHPADRAFT_889384 [Schizopora paradoxa]
MYPPQRVHHGHYREASTTGRNSSLADGPNRMQSERYVSDLEGKARTLGSRMSSSARRSRKSSVSNRELLRVLFEEKTNAQNVSDDLEDAYDRIKREAKRVSDAERVTLETNERLRGMNHARLAAQQEAARLQAELRLYKIQYDNAQRQLLEANAIINETDIERERAEKAASKMRRALEKYRESELARRAREEGRREARDEMLREVIREKERLALEMERLRVDNDTLGDEDLDDDEDIRDQTARHTVANVADNVPLIEAPDPEDPRIPMPIVEPPPEPQTQAPPPAPPMPSAEPSGPVIPPEIPEAMTSMPPMPIPGIIVDEVTEPAIPPPTVPDHIIVRSPARSDSSPFGMAPAMPVPMAQPIPQPSGYPINPSKSSSSRSRPQHSRHHSVPDYSSSSSSSGSTITPEMQPRPLSSAGRRTPVVNLEYAGVPPPLSSRTPDPYRQRAATPGIMMQPENIVPLPPYGASGGRNTPGLVRPMTGNPYNRPRVSSVSSSSSVSTSEESDGRRTPKARPLSRASGRPSLRHSRQWSSEDSSIPGITIEPPSRPESLGSVVTTTTAPMSGSHHGAHGHHHHHPHHSAHGFQGSVPQSAGSPFMNNFGGAAAAASPLSSITIEGDTLPQGFVPSTAIPEGGIPRPPTAPPNFVPMGIAVDPVTGSPLPLGMPARPYSRSSTSSTSRRPSAPQRTGSAADYYNSEPGGGMPSGMRTPRPSPLRNVSYGRPPSRTSTALNTPGRPSSTLPTSEPQYMIDVVPLSPGGSGVHPTQFRDPALSPVTSVRSQAGGRSRPTSMAFGHTPYHSSGTLPSFYE